MKKILSSMLSLALLLGTFTAAVHAETPTCTTNHITMIDPVLGDIYTKNQTHLDTYYEDGTQAADYQVIEDKLSSSKRITKLHITTSGKIDNELGNYILSTSNTEGNRRMRYRVYNDDGTLSAPLWNIQNNFVWEFDLKVDNLASNQGLNILLGNSSGSSWRNQIRILANSYTKTEDARYAVRWYGVDGSTVTKQFTISGDSDSNSYQLLFGETYHLKIEADVRNNQLYVTFSGNVNGEDYVSKNDKAPFQMDTAANIEKDDYILPYKISTTGAVDITFDNMAFFVDRFSAKTPTLTAGNGSVTASTQVKNTTNTNYTNIAPPSIIAAVYKQNGELVKCSVTEGAGDFDYGVSTERTAVVDGLGGLADGTYKVKAFIWNSLNRTSGLKAYDNALVEKTATVSGGTITLN